MRKLAAVLLAALLSTHCGMLRNIRTGSAREGAVQALVTTTRSAVLLMTAAGIAYDAGALGPPGSPRAEDTWKKIANESIRMGEALTAWTEAIKANKDGSTYASMVAQALAVIGALLPTRPVSELNVPPWFTVPTYHSIVILGHPDGFRARRVQTLAGGF